MRAIQTILHPTDFSERSESAFLLACSLARDYDADLIVVHVADPPMLVTDQGGIVATLEQHYENVKEKLEQLKTGNPRACIRWELAIGSPATEILRVANENDVDLIVMGTHGRTGLTRLLMGSVAEQVVRKAFCPVLTIKYPFAEVLPVQETAEKPVEKNLEPSIP
jgi:nucleotide-binding universal stress UspA family protein